MTKHGMVTDTVSWPVRCIKGVLASLQPLIFKLDFYFLISTCSFFISKLFSSEFTLETEETAENSGDRFLTCSRCTEDGKLLSVDVHGYSGIRGTKTEIFTITLKTVYEPLAF